MFSDRNHMLLGVTSVLKKPASNVAMKFSVVHLSTVTSKVALVAKRAIKPKLRCLGAISMGRIMCNFQCIAPESGLVPKTVYANFQPPSSARLPQSNSMDGASQWSSASIAGDGEDSAFSSLYGGASGNSAVGGHRRSLIGPAGDPRSPAIPDQVLESLYHKAHVYKGLPHEVSDRLSSLLLPAFSGLIHILYVFSV